MPDDGGRAAQATNIQMYCACILADAQERVRIAANAADVPVSSLLLATPPVAA